MLDFWEGQGEEIVEGKMTDTGGGYLRRGSNTVCPTTEPS